MAVHEDFDPRDMRCWYQMFSAVAGLGAIGLDSRHGFGEDSAPLSGLRFQDLQKFGFTVGYAAAGPGWMPRWRNRVAMSVRRCS